MGIASGKDYKDITVHQLLDFADKEMYKDKKAYYETSGFDRRNR